MWRGRGNLKSADRPHLAKIAIRLNTMMSSGQKGTILLEIHLRLDLNLQATGA